MRIAYVITRADAVGGASIHVRDLAAAMLARGHDARVFVGGSGPFTEQLKTAGVPFHSLQFLDRDIRPVRDAAAYRELSAALSGFRPDLVSAHTAKAGWIARAASARSGIPTIYTPHGWAITDRVSRTGGLFYRAAEMIAARWTSAIVCVCEHERKLAIQKRVGRPDQFHVIYNGVRDVPPSFLARPELTPVRIVCVARFEAPKDHATLLAALALLGSLPWELELIGDGPLESSIRAQSERLGLAGRVKFSGYQPDPALALARAQIFVLSSRSEAFPRSILEAMRAGLPVIASSVGGIPEAVKDGRTGMLVPRGSIQALSDALRHMIINGEIRQRLGAASHLRFRDRFRLGYMIEATASLYGKLVTEP